MFHGGISHLKNAPTRLPQPEAEIDVFGPVEVRLVKTPYLLEGGAPDQLTGADGEVHIPGSRAGGSLDPGVPVTQPEHPRQLAAQVRGPAAAGLGRLVHKDRRREGNSLVRQHRSGQLGEALRPQDRITVEEADEWCTPEASPLVAGRRDAPIDVVPHQTYGRMVDGLHGWRGTIVDHDDSSHHARAGEDRVNCPSQQRPVVPREHHDVDRWGQRPRLRHNTILADRPPYDVAIRQSAQTNPLGVSDTQPADPA